MKIQIISLITKHILFLVLLFVCLFSRENVSGQVVRDNAADSLMSKYINEAMNYLDSTGDSSLQLADISIAMAREHNNAGRLADAYNVKALWFMSNSRYQESLQCFDSVLVYAEKVGDVFRLNTVNNNIGVIFRRQGAYETSIRYFVKSLEFANQCNDTISVIYSLTNLGSSLAALDNYNSALMYYSKALNLMLKSGETHQQIPYLYVNVANIFKRQLKYQNALHLYEKALIDFDALGNHQACLRIGISQAEVYSSIGKTETAIETIEKAKQLAELIDNTEQKEAFYKTAYELYAKAGMMSKAYEYLELYAGLRDINTDLELKKIIENIQQQYEMDVLNVRNAQNEERLQRQQLMIVLMVGAIVLACIVVLVLIVRYLEKNKHNRQLYEKNLLIEQQHKAINDSIEYAESIMSISLVQPKASDFMPQHFIWFRPKDKVGGDFYRIYHQGSNWFAVLGDCTGHGVAGAFLAGVYVRLLDAVFQNSFCGTAEVMHELNKKHIDFFGNETSDDVMHLRSCEISILMINPLEKIICFSGLYHKMIFQSDKGSKLVSSDRISLGFADDYKCSETKIAYHSKNRLFLFTDGFPDQLNATASAKISRNVLLKLISDLYTINIEEVKPMLETYYNKHRQDAAQTDDILIIGLELQ